LRNLPSDAGLGASTTSGVKVRVVRISVEIGLETSYEIWKGQFGNVLCGPAFPKHLSWQGIALNARVNDR
jgi:hypothetical protein